MRSENTSNIKQYTFRGRELDLSRPRVMGILNTTPDSFSDGGLFVSGNAAIERIAAMADKGADIIDVGGESTRPGSEPVSVGEEMDRVIPVLEKALPAFKECLFSVDTTKYEVAEAALELGVHMVNDVSGLRKEPRLAPLCARFNAGYILMHSKGDPKTMQQDPQYENVIEEIRAFFRGQLKQLINAGVKPVILDPGIGFGKTLAHNLEIVASLDKFTEFGYPLMVGASRKSMIGQILNDRPVHERLTGTIAIHYHCLLKGAKILRVHDVQEAKDSVQVYHAVQAAQP
jgi:dihydropteroate synthase